MNIAEFTGLTLVGGFAAGLVGSLTGLGGGVVIIPLLTLALGVDIRYAIGASLVSVIATSSGAAAAYVREGFTNLRVGMFLEIATTFGALAAALVASRVPVTAIAIVFGGVLILSALLSARRQEKTAISHKPDRLSRRLRMDSAYPNRQGRMISYRVRQIPGGFAVMFVAGMLSGLLGIGSGALKVLAMDLIMRLPLKVSTTTSNFMIGVTAAASAGVYLHRGYINPAVAMPVMLGVLAGSLLGARYLPRAHVRGLRLFFVAVILALGVEMIFNGATGGFR
ncbi:MAG: sulfite exporter TauE/SafE family protein [Actinobacteria bacterium]|nr:sulfite exporter TauE/SafE family protein [Actinomycetota bacterium]